jgi:hypothetical protein
VLSIRCRFQLLKISQAGMVVIIGEIPNSRLKFIAPKPLDDAISKLRERAAAYIQKIPAT